MLDEAHLPVATHVARREVAKATQESTEAAGNWSLLTRRVLAPIRERFRRGSQLTGESLAALVVESRRTLSASKHVFLEEIARAPTRTRPRAEGHEFFFVARGPGPSPNDTHYSTVAIRLFLSRRKAEMTMDWPGLDFTRHLLERTIERRLAAWTGGFAEVDENVVEHAGLLIVWRHLLATGAVENPEVAIPLSNGLMLGSFREDSPGATGYRYLLDKEIRRPRSMGPNPFLSPAGCPDGARGVRFMTAVDESLLRIPQFDLRDMLRDFNTAHRVTLSSLAVAALWRGAVLREIPEYGSLRSTIEDLARDLLPILRTTAAVEALSRERIEHEAFAPVEEPPAEAVVPAP